MTQRFIHCDNLEVIAVRKNESTKASSNVLAGQNNGECRRGVMVKAMDCGIIVSEFELQSLYYVHFRANTLGKGMNLLILPAMG